ncbi:AAA family ATPase [Rhizobium helianthi]|uniref:AAA family ATPase n=1 Tax=Rhizobium helianthi TaxID=1132695 RepID=A0ABW4M002_9HYPH
MDDDKTLYCIKGFRSLLDFQIQLNSGLNVIVGPNGAGKTNFIEFLDFINSLIRFGAANAVSMSGGVSKVFSTENFNKKTPLLSCEITSTALINTSEDKIELNKNFRFRYFIEVKFNKTESQIYISKEKITVYKCHDPHETVVSLQKVGSIQITRNGISDFLEPKLHITDRIYAKSERNPFSYTRPIYGRKEIKDAFDRTDIQSLEPDQSILSVRPVFSAIDAMRRVIGRGKSFNIIPEKARNADHISRSPFIEPDGTGLSSVLYFLKKLKDGNFAKAPYAFRVLDPDAFSTVMHWTNLVLPELEDINITQDLHLGRYVVTLSIRKEKPLRVSIQAASDGTIKWLTLICLIVTNRGMGCLEEPENFLHPKMQSYLVEIIRDSINEHGRDYFIITTHSETLINSCKPEELIIFQFGSSGTKCIRLSHPSKIKAEINDTGFGLGYYYAANAL